MTALVGGIQKFSTEDGPGIRTTVFMKGCPLSCMWCHNPEGLSTARQLMYKKNFCTHCGACRKPCQHPECHPFGRCVHACAAGCLSIAGEEISVQQLAQRLRKRGEILKRMDGGITISGGEPMLQFPFIRETAALREVFGKTAIPPFQAWLEKMGFVENGRLTKKAGDGSSLMF